MTEYISSVDGKTKFRLLYLFLQKELSEWEELDQVSQMRKVYEEAEKLTDGSYTILVAEALQRFQDMNTILSWCPTKSHGPLDDHKVDFIVRTQDKVLVPLQITSKNLGIRKRKIRLWYAAESIDPAEFIPVVGLRNAKRVLPPEEIDNRLMFAISKAGQIWKKIFPDVIGRTNLLTQ